MSLLQHPPKLQFSVLISSLCAAICIVVVYIHIFTTCSIHLRRLWPPSVSYSNGSTYFAFSNLSISPSLPRPSSPSWGSITVRDLEYKYTHSHLSVSTLSVKLWFFPRTLRFSHGPWVSVTAEGYKLLVHKSNQTPQPVQSLRANLFRTILTGEYLRLDDFKSSLQFNLKSDLDDNTSNGVYSRTDHDRGKDAVTITTSAVNWNIRNEENSRIYSFGNLRAQVRRSWVKKRGSVVVIALESYWTKVHRKPASEITLPLWRQIFSALMSFPADLITVIHDPLSTIDLYVSRADITFAEFRMRDAELLRQAGELLTERIHGHETLLGDILLDTFLKALAPS